MDVPLFAAVDWGTSSFRLWLIGADGAVIAERRAPEGMTVARELGFEKVLEDHLGALGAPSDLPVVICGMAGAKQGWREAGYLDVPCHLDAISAGAIRVAHARRDIRILPGLAQHLPDADVMRGEETQLLGAMAGIGDGEHLVAMPGTHSKWVRMVDGSPLGFDTYMTGELFAALSQHTILMHALKDSPGFDGLSAAFLDAVETGHREPHRISARMFSIRARGLLTGLSPEDAEARLSGLLIGLELAGAIGQAGTVPPVTLVASGKLGSLYEAALGHIGVAFSPINADDAVRQGLIAAAHAIWPN